MKPRVFIGSSSENKEIAEAIQCNISDFSFPVIWDQSITTLSQSTLSNLLDNINGFDFAIFVFGAEDTAVMRDNCFSIVRDNIIFETGLFMGKLGPQRVFFVRPTSENMHLPSDLLGINYGTYDEKHPNTDAALRPFCIQVKKQIQRLFIPELPKDDLFGPNILNPEITDFIGNTDPLGNGTRYGLYANTSSSQKVTVRIQKTSESQYSLPWYFDLSNKQGWLEIKNIEKGFQDFILFPDNKGIINIFFVGEGTADISVKLNDNTEPFLRKSIQWKHK